MTLLSRSGLTMPLYRRSVETFPETSSHATCQGTFDHSRLISATVDCSWHKEWNWCAQADLHLKKKKKHRRWMNHKTFPQNPHKQGKSHHFATCTFSPSAHWNRANSICPHLFQCSSPCPPPTNFLKTKTASVLFLKYSHKKSILHVLSILCSNHAQNLGQSQWNWYDSVKVLSLMEVMLLFIYSEKRQRLKFLSLPQVWTDRHVCIINTQTVSYETQRYWSKMGMDKSPLGISPPDTSPSLTKTLDKSPPPAYFVY